MLKTNFDKIFTKDFLEEWYGSGRHTIKQLSETFGCGVHRIWKRINYFKIPAPIKGYMEISATNWNSLQNGARRRNIPFGLSIEDGWELFIKQNRKCALSGRELKFCYPPNQTACLDRIDSNKSYTKDNIQWIHKDINKMKLNFPIESYIQMCEDISKYYIQKIYICHLGGIEL